MRILGACIFSKSFGGKIGVFWTANTYRTYKFFTQKTRKRSLSARIFSKSFGGEIKSI